MDNVKPKPISLEFLKEITDGFSHNRILGRGTFGVVYKGEHGDGKEIAVKMLKFMGGVEDHDFKKEFNNLAMLKHPNIIQLLGFCNETENVVEEYNGVFVPAIILHRGICFEYMHNGSLRKHLHDVDHGFGWHKRYRIIKGICEGLKYLHTRKPAVFHLDLKPDNILLDKNMVPKIADFGLSRLLGEESTKMTVSNVGSRGYLPPEYINLQLISKEFDIFSLGVIIIRIIVGHAGYSLIGEMEKAEFTEHVSNKWKERLQLIPGYALAETDCQQVKKCIEVALQCLESDKKKRPTIGYIVDQLNYTEKHTNRPESWVEEFDDREPTRANKSNIPEREPSLLSTLPNEVPLDFLKEITSDFSEERIISEDAFGTVYEGVLGNGQVVAVKKLAEHMQVPAGEKFLKAATHLMAVQHDNIVRLLSCCSESKKKVVEHKGKYILVDMDQCVLCYEFLPKGNLHDYLSESANRTNWDANFKIIKGICQGLMFLHQEMMLGKIVHLDLHPANILLDNNKVPKIANIGLSRLFDTDKSRTYTRNVVGLKGYMAPEYLYRGEISLQCDIYSLGVLIIEITTGEKNFSNDKDMAGRNFIDMIRNTWTIDHIASTYSSLKADRLVEVKACIDIGLECVHVYPKDRPSIAEIVDKLTNGIYWQEVSVHPAKVWVPFKPNKLISCSLHLTNTKDDVVAVRLVTESTRRYNAKMPLCCIVPPKCTYTLVVTRSQQKKQLLSSSRDEFLTLESTIIADGDSGLKNAYDDSAATKFSKFFKKAKEAAPDKVYELKLNVVSEPLQETASVQPQHSEIEIISDRKFSQVLSVDVHQTKPWILTANHGGEVVIWDFQAQETVNSFDFTQKPVYAAKFIEREQWLVAGDGCGTIYVYCYDTGEEVTSIEAHEGDIKALAVHPTDPLVLSSSEDHLIKLWSWKNDCKEDWEGIRTFKGHMDTVAHVNFNPMDTNSFATACLDRTIKIWNLSSSESKITLSDHQDRQLCVHNYSTDMGQYLIAGSCDGTAQIWDMETGICVQTLEGHVRAVSCAYRHPELPVLITGSHDGTLRVWNTTTYRLENIIGINLGAVYALGYITDLRRIVVGCHQGIAIMEIELP